MPMDLTKEAAEGFDWHNTDTSPIVLDGKSADRACPYLATSPSAMAWHLGRHLAKGGFVRPGDNGWTVLTSRGNSFKFCIHPRDHGNYVRFQWLDDNTFAELD